MDEARKWPTSELRRTTLLERLEHAPPRILALVASAGFGKSTLARQFASERGPWAVCDCRGARDALDVARRLVSALVSIEPEGSAELAHLEHAIGDGGRPLAERLGVAIEAWRHVAAGTIVFEHGEVFSRSGPMREFLIQLLDTRSPELAVVLCSREPLRVPMTRFAAPHETVLLRAADLAFDTQEVRRLFEGVSLDDATIARVIDVSRGWPISLLLVKRLAAQGRLTSLLERLDSVLAEELRDYFAHEVLASLKPLGAAALFTCAAIPGATESDVRGAHVEAQALDALRELAQESPFIVRSAAGEYRVHPLLASALLIDQVERCAAVRAQVATYHHTHGRYVRAAQLHLLRSDQVSAARELVHSEVAFDRSPSVAYLNVLAQLDAALLQHHARLWSVWALTQLYRVDAAALLDEARTVWRTLSPDTALADRWSVIAIQVLCLRELGRLAEALALLDRFDPQIGAADNAAVLDAFRTCMRSLLLARMGHTLQGESELTRALAQLEGVGPWSLFIVATLATDIARIRAERPVEQRLLDRAFERARGSGWLNVAAVVMAEACFGAWFAGDDAAAAAYGRAFARAVARDGVQTLSSFARVADGGAYRSESGEHTRYAIFAQVMAASRASDRAQARGLAQAAFALSQLTDAPFERMVAAIAAAMTHEGERETFFEGARMAAARFDRPSLLRAVDEVAAATPGSSVLHALVARFVPERASLGVMSVDIVHGVVRVDGAPRTLSARELEIVIALAVHREGVERERLAAMLWPDRDEADARNALSVALHRLRAHLGRAGAIVRAGNGYRLSPGTRVDFWEIERAAAALRGPHGRLGDDARADLERLFALLDGRRPERMVAWEWFEPFERRLRELRTAASHRLAADAFERNDPASALRYAGEIVVDDPCDEPAQELAIRAHLAMGDRAAAGRQFRQYREALRKEMGCDPSPSVAALLTGKGEALVPANSTS